MSDEHGNLVLACGEEQKRCGMVSKIGEVGSLEGCAGRKSACLGEIKAEGQFALEPGLDGVAVG